MWAGVLTVVLIDDLAATAEHACRCEEKVSRIGPPQHGCEVLEGGIRAVHRGALAISPVKMLYQPVPFIWVLLVKQQSSNRVEYIRELDEPLDLSLSHYRHQ